MKLLCWNYLAQQYFPWSIAATATTIIRWKVAFLVEKKSDCFLIFKPKENLTLTSLGFFDIK